MPPIVPTDLGPPGGAPSRTVQAPTIRAFRQFILHTGNRTKDGELWTALPILNELWSLWPERAAHILFADFRDWYKGTVELFRDKKSKKYSTQHLLLFVLIMRFLDARGRTAFHPAIGKMLAQAIKGMSLLLPLEINIPCINRYKEGTHLLEWSARDGKGSGSFVALRIPKFEQAQPCCLAIMFDTRFQHIEYGVYAHYEKTLYMRDDWRSPELYTQYRLELDRHATKQPGMMWFPGNVQNNPPIDGRPINLFYGSRTRTGGWIKLSTDAAATAFADAYFKLFDN